jgi:hypothetical protein
LKNVLIISPRFPPVNAADMHRVRQSLPYLPSMGWRPIVLAVRPDRVEGYRDELLLQTVPDDTEVHHVSALPTRWTRTVGLGDLAMRALPSYLRACSRLIRQQSIDLVYFSTTAFPVLALGRYWKQSYGIPYVIDMQDPWYTGSYVKEGKRSLKARLSDWTGRCLEPLAMRGVGGLLAVSQGYCTALAERYESITPSMCATIPFGAAERDFDVLEGADLDNPFFVSGSDCIDVVYVGRGGHDMEPSSHGLFGAIARGLNEKPALFGKLRLHLVGTSYAPAGQGEKTLEPIAEEYGVDDQVSEHPARVPYFQTLHLLREGDMLVLPGSDDPNYTASKLYPYILAKKPLLAVFHENSSVVDILRETQAGRAVTFEASTPEESLGECVYETWSTMLERLPYTPETDWQAFEPYTAEAMTRRQVKVFDEAVSEK